MIVSEEPKTVPRTTKGHRRTQFETIALLLQERIYLRIGFLEFQSAQSMRRSLPASLHCNQTDMRMKMTLIHRWMSQSHGYSKWETCHGYAEN
jgi:hypothetical protein